MVCRNMFPKYEMIRIVRDAEGNVCIDSSGKKDGRGYYICNSEECISKCISKKILNKALKANINVDLYLKLDDEHRRNK